MSETLWYNRSDRFAPLIWGASVCDVVFLSIITEHLFRTSTLVESPISKRNECFTPLICGPQGGFLSVTWFDVKLLSGFLFSINCQHICSIHPWVEWYEQTLLDTIEHYFMFLMCCNFEEK